MNVPNYVKLQIKVTALLEQWLKEKPEIINDLVTKYSQESLPKSLLPSHKKMFEEAGVTENVWKPLLSLSSDESFDDVIIAIIKEQIDTQNYPDYSISNMVGLPIFANQLSTERVDGVFSKPKALKPLDVFLTGHMVISLPRDGGDGVVCVRVSFENTVEWIIISESVPVALKKTT